MPGPLAPPEPTDPSQDALVLRAADAAEVVTPDDAPGMVPVDAGRQAQIAAQAREFVDEVAGLDPRSPAFTEKVDGINAIASSEIARSGGFSSRMLERSQSSVAGAKRTGDGAQVKVATTLGDLRSTVEDLTPNQADLSTGRKILGMIPGGNKLAKYFQRYESAQTQLDKIIKSLMAGQDELRKDNATLADEKVQLWETMQQLSEYAVFAKALDAATVSKIESLRNGGRVDEAQKLESDVLFPVRQRHQDILTQLAVSVQGYLAMDLVRKNNTELIKGVERARTTTIAALRTAVVVAQALANQKMVLDQIDAVNNTTNAMILQTSEMLRDQTTRIHEQATNSGVSVETLQKAFDNVFQTMDAIDSFRSQAAQNMSSTVSALESGIQRAKPYLERARQGDDDQRSVTR
ncbi:toxic anion resistance protein [Curtobacterium sp. MCJR17_055]|uniref:toxic anion resistance protein n=1 Tax=unclassified Curtobacterium TaxID=257496 RepID=UPI000D9D34EF|nr:MULTISPECIES: toxic anion resistance protein [unclassified Curtobacterium]PYY35093.1 toxic anion resistance protein [Curtobacterium sp. MCBD17_029]PYY42373.1 toxic anion resistance protein [Curtobacterium sp. MCPF17_046]PYY51063.1 toxic anion resistance protein [Curtobacterium sp. MCBD17_023]PYY55627.1 toxic anion resistance protein [Curtobacterium sp. MCJR17_055]PYY60372.1 toxic anion resistance protein [Curtobacterium sp. MCPF17_015]